MYAQDNNSLPVWIILSPGHHHISINSQPFLVGIVSLVVDTQLVDVTQSTTKVFGKRLRKHNNQAQNDPIGLKTVKTVKVLPFVTDVIKDNGGADLKR